MSKKVMIAMSGGVDSSVAAWLIQQHNYDCIGATMLLCPLPNDTRDARSIAARLDIPFLEYDARSLFKQQVMDSFVDVYHRGGTPNPCFVCNNTMKFGFLLDKALENGCSHIVTGHYARIKQINDRYVLCKAPDENKDQSYFLAGLTQHQLSHILFPLGEMSKEQVRQIAQEQGFINAQKKDSQDICFVPDGDYYEFIKSHTGEHFPCGAFLDQNGKPVGTHKGAMAYTIGQRKGLGLAMGEPVYVTAKDMGSNTVTVGPESLLFTRTLIAENPNWILYPSLFEPMRVTAKARSRHKGQPAWIYPDNGAVRVVFDEPQRALTPGQAVVFYDGELVVGSGTITDVLY